jgi:type IV pilus assembly protein PilC
MIPSRNQVQALYQYIAYDKNQEAVRGKLLATSEEAVIELLGFEGFQVTNVKQLAPAISLRWLKSQFSQVKTGDIILLYRQLALLLESGINIITALDLLKAQITNRTLKEVLTAVITDLRAGNQLSAALSKYPKIFAPIYCRSLSVGEQAGGLELILRQIAEYMEKDSVAAKRTKSALTYPVIALVMTIAVVALMVTFVLPAFTGLYSSLGADLPLLARLMLSGATMLQHYGIFLLLALIIAAALGYIYIRTPQGRYKFDGWLLRLPLLGHVNHLNELARCCKSIALLYRAGLPLTEIMTMVIEGTNNRVVAEALVGVQQAMLQGEGLSQPMAKNEVFLSMMVQMVKVGEETGNLDINLAAVAQSYETDADDRTRSLISLIQPVTTIIIGFIVGLIALSLVSAMYSVYSQAI